MPQIVGNKSIDRFDVLIVGSGAGGSAAAEMLTRNGLKVLILESGPNYFENLDHVDFSKVSTQLSGDELKLTRRRIIYPDPVAEPRTFRKNESKVREFIGEVNDLPKTVGGGGVHADMKAPRFHPQDFKMRSLGVNPSGTNFADWPISYEELDPFYLHLEYLLGVQGQAEATPFDPPRTKPFPMVPGVPMYVGLLASDAARKLGYYPFRYPTAINSTAYDGRPACINCGWCGQFGCLTGAKGSPAVTGIRKALLTGNCLLVSETKATRLFKTGRKITGLEAIGPDGKTGFYQADRYVLSASPIEDVRLLQMSDPGGNGIGNSNDLVGRNLMFHYQTYAIGVFDKRLHTHRGSSVTHGLLDFRGTAEDKSRPLGGIVEIGGEAGVISEAVNYVTRVGMTGFMLKTLMKQSPFRDRLMAFIMQGEDAPQLSNRVDLDPNIRDFDRLPVPRVTYKSHDFELSAQKYYSPKLLEIFKVAGAKYGFIAPNDKVPSSRHILGTLRFGNDPTTSVCDSTGRFHELDNLFAADGSLFPTSSGINPTLTIMALSSYVAAQMVFPGNPEKALKFSEANCK
jgi:choline dehydrogenase-like flavoprotein